MRDDEIRGRKRIAHELGVSVRTVSRLMARGTLPARKLNGSTSPLRIERRSLDDLLKRR